MAMTTLVFLIMVIFFYAPLIYVFILIVKALRKYLKSSDIRKDKNETKVSLGEALKTYRSNLLALAKLYGVSAEEILTKIK